MKPRITRVQTDKQYMIIARYRDGVLMAAQRGKRFDAAAAKMVASILQSDFDSRWTDIMICKVVPFNF